MEIAETSGRESVALEAPAPRMGGLRKSLSWLLGAQLARLALGFIVGTMLARTLGVAEYGRLSTALGITTLAAFFAELGLRQVIVKEMAQHPRIAGSLMGTGFHLLCGLGLVALLVSAGVVAVMQRADLVAATLVLSTVFLLNGHVAIYSRWDALGEAWRAPRFAMIASVASNAAKIICIIAGLGVVAICGAIVLECFIAAALVVIFALRSGWLRDIRSWHPLAAKALLVRAFPHFLAQGGTLLLLRLDQVMLNAMSGNKEAGIYGAATRLSELIFLLIPVMVASYLSRLAAIERTNPAAFRRTAEALLQVMSVVGIAAPLLWWLFGNNIVQVIYGRQFADCGPVLFIHCLSSLAYLHGQVRSIVLITTGRAYLGAYAAYAGMAINVTLNLWWIPEHGAQGAAWATAVSYYVVWFAGTFAMPDLRWLAMAQIRSLAAPLLMPFRWRETLRALRAA